MPTAVASLLNNLTNYLMQMLYTLPVLLIAFPIHECSHGLVAYALGDDTAKRQGRITLNPLKHLDPFGTIMLVIAHFGWAKPVPVNPNNFKNRKAGMALVAFAGPISNLIMGFLSLVLFKVFFSSLSGNISTVQYVILDFIRYSVIINVGLFIFNLIPIPPLDGSRIIALFLPGKAEDFYYRYGSILQVALIMLIFFGAFTGPLMQMENNVIGKFMNILQMSNLT
jgi:Zn-dependent protease